MNREALIVCILCFLLLIVPGFLAALVEEKPERTERVGTGGPSIWNGCHPIPAER